MKNIIVVALLSLQPISIGAMGNLEAPERQAMDMTQDEQSEKSKYIVVPDGMKWVARKKNPKATNSCFGKTVRAVANELHVCGIHLYQNNWYVDDNPCGTICCVACCLGGAKTLYSCPEYTAPACAVFLAAWGLWSDKCLNELPEGGRAQVQRKVLLLSESDSEDECEENSSKKKED